MNASESIKVDTGQLSILRKLVSRGEGLTLEFKRKAAHPDKIVRELIAFGNTQGGTLLIGVDDNGTIPGIKYPEEELLAVREAIEKHCRPALTIAESIVAVDPKHFVARIDVILDEKRPHYFKLTADTRESYVRSGDMSVKASREMIEIVRRSRKGKDIRFTFGEAEKSLMEYLELKKTISVDEFKTLAKLNRFAATRKLILLVLANVLRIQPTEKGDLYSRVG